MYTSWEEREQGSATAAARDQPDEDQGERAEAERAGRPALRDAAVAPAVHQHRHLAAVRSLHHPGHRQVGRERGVAQRLVVDDRGERRVADALEGDVVELPAEVAGGLIRADAE